MNSQVLLQGRTWGTATLDSLTQTPLNHADTPGHPTAPGLSLTMSPLPGLPSPNTQEGRTLINWGHGDILPSINQG